MSWVIFSFRNESCKSSFLWIQWSIVVYLFSIVPLAFQNTSAINFRNNKTVRYSASTSLPLSFSFSNYLAPFHLFLSDFFEDFCLKNLERLKRVEFRYEIEKSYKRKLYRARVAFDAWSFKNERGRGRYIALGYPRKLTSLPNERTCKVVSNFIKYLREPLLAVESCLTNRPSWRVLTSCVCKSNGNTIINEQTRTYEHRRQLRKKFLISKERWNKKKKKRKKKQRKEKRIKKKRISNDL